MDIRLKVRRSEPAIDELVFDDIFEDGARVDTADPGSTFMNNIWRGPLPSRPSSSHVLDSVRA